MMNIICNNCVGARMYNVMDTEFPNPFMWSLVSADDFIKIMNSFDLADLSSASFELERYKNSADESIVIRLPQDVTVHFIHYIKDDAYATPQRVDSINIRYHDIISYAKEKWAKRLNRMKDYGDPVYLYAFNGAVAETYVRDLPALWTASKPLVIVTERGVNLPSAPNENIRVISYQKEVMDYTSGRFARTIMDDAIAAFGKIS